MRSAALPSPPVSRGTAINGRSLTGPPSASRIGITEWAVPRALSRGTPAEIGQVMDTQASCNFAQALTARREEAAQQPALAQLLQPRPPALGTAAQPVEDSCQLLRNSRLALAKEPPRV